MEFDWDAANRGHVAVHGLSDEDVVRAFGDTDRISCEAYDVYGEKRWATLASGGSGRLLFIVYTMRHGKIRVITARDATRRERRRYVPRGGF